MMSVLLSLSLIKDLICSVSLFTTYDNVNRDKLWEMMENKIPNYLLNTIKCIYRNTKVRIKFNDGISEPIYTNKGVRQGCGLSPTLFNIYINKIVQEFKIVIRQGLQLSSEHHTVCRRPDFNGHI